MATETTNSEKPHRTMADRAFFAYQCLPKTPLGGPPPMRELERSVGLSHNTLPKLFKGILKRPGFDVLTRIAEALRVTPEWLQREEGEGPKTGYPVPPRPPEWQETKSPGAGATIARDRIGRFKQDAARKLANRPTPGGRRNTGK